MAELLDEVTFVMRLITDNWSSSATSLYNSGKISINLPVPKVIDVRSIEPNEGRRVDADSDSAVIVVFEDSSSTTYPTIDYAVRSESFTFTIHIRVLHRRDFADNTTSRDRLRILYRIVRHILETNSLSPTISTTVGGTTYTDSAEIIKLQSRSEANDRKKRLLGYKLGVEMKRMGRSV
tara:strand:+ start:1045 stop:1581 length:537 start_codon:yes stop_codon:yes gene_type:complete